MLPAAHRLLTSGDFAVATRRGHRAASGTLVLHLGTAPDSPAPRVGFVVSKAVGPATTRNLVKRRLRSAARDALDALPGSAVLVVRALPAAAGSSYAELVGDFDRALRVVLAKAAAPATVQAP